ncbi:MAG TPA: hypothetical protein PK440_20360 [Candidatus Accumulibacter phosphatis]|nr:hypothetical protein [Candidatus Accumulibacter phosphatis]
MRRADHLERCTAQREGRAWRR